jgi:dTDP-4-dehydrorhamnose reductase
MRRLAIAGVDSVVGAAVMVHFDGTTHVTGVRLDEVDAFEEVCDDVTDLIVCGDAAVSSWDTEINHISQDTLLLPDYVRIATDADVRLIYISSDVIFEGPWVFHDDSNTHFSSSKLTSQIRANEELVLHNPKNLVVRTNAITEGSESFVTRLRDSFEKQIRLELSANQFATPLSASRLAILLDHVLLTPASGVTHVAGAERMSPWTFATHLANSEGADQHLLTPLLSTKPCERSLRCTRARQEFQLRMPTLNQTMQELSHSATQTVRRAA